MARQTHTIDASKKTLGRLATSIAVLLIGKHKPSFTPNKDDGDYVEIVHIDEMVLTGNKMEQKMYYHHTGYPGGLKSDSAARVVENKGIMELLKRAVWNMLPKNKLRKEMIKRLKCIK